MELLRRGGVLSDKSLTMGSLCSLGSPLAWLSSPGSQPLRLWLAYYHPRRHVVLVRLPFNFSSRLSRQHSPTPHPCILRDQSVPILKPHWFSTVSTTTAVSPTLFHRLRRCSHRSLVPRPLTFWPSPGLCSLSPLSCLPVFLLPHVLPGSYGYSSSLLSSLLFMPLPALLPALLLASRSAPFPAAHSAPPRSVLRYPRSDRIHHPRRGHPRDQPPRQRDRARRHPPSGEHHQVHQFRA